MFPRRLTILPLDKRFEQVDGKFGDMFNFLWILTGILTILTVSVIGFAYWDRRAMIRKAKEETIEEILKKRFICDIVRCLAKEANKLANVLRQFH